MAKMLGHLDPAPRQFSAESTTFGWNAIRAARWVWSPSSTNSLVKIWRRSYQKRYAPKRFGGGLMPGFDDAWNAVARARGQESVSPKLRPLLETVYSQSLSCPVYRSRLKQSLEDLLEFLSVEGRTNANCWAVDLFFANSQGWERDWAEQDLPEDLHDIIAMMSQALHDTVSAPEIAKNFGCLPEQLIERLRRLPQRD